MKKSVKLYVIVTYVMFLFLLLIAAGVMSVFNQPIVGKLAPIPCSWTPTIALLVLFPKLGLHMTRGEFFKRLFKEKLNIKLLAGIWIIQISMFIACLLLVAEGHTLKELLRGNGSTIALLAVNHALTGATGEEAGWRGYLQPIFNEKYGVIKGSALLGVVWGFWHAPLWFLTLGYTGIALVKYIICFLVFIISAAVIIGICYERNTNILIPVGIHYCVNFVMGLYTGKMIDIIGYIAATYLMIAIVFSFYQVFTKLEHFKG